MIIFLKHILRNICEKKGRSALIIISLIIATSTFVLNLTLPSEIVLKMNSTMRSIYGDSDLLITSHTPIHFDNIDVPTDDVQICGMTEIETIYNNEPALILGVEQNSVETLKLLYNMPALTDKEALISAEDSKKYGIYTGDTIEVIINGEKTNISVLGVLDNKGLLSIESKYPLFVMDQEYVNSLVGYDSGYSDQIYVNVIDDELVREFKNHTADKNELLVESLADVNAIKEQTSFISNIMLMIFIMALVMIFFVISSLNRIIMSERMPVTGTFRSTGASRKMINMILLMENVLYGLVGGLIGSFGGFAVNKYVAEMFIATDTVQLSENTSAVDVSVIFAGVLFAVALETLVSIGTIVNTSKKSIKNIIFDIPSVRFEFKITNLVVGLIFLFASVFCNMANTSYNIIVAIVSIFLIMISASLLVPFVMRAFSLALKGITSVIPFGTINMACKNIGYNKLIISSARLITITLSLAIAIATVSSSFYNLLNSYSYTVNSCDIVVSNVSKPASHYDEVLKNDEIESIAYMYAYTDSNVRVNGGEFDQFPTVLGMNESKNYIQELGHSVSSLTGNEMLIDEKYAKANNIEVGENIELEFKTTGKKIELRVVGFVNSTYYSTSRNVIVVDLDYYKENITPNVVQVLITVKSDYEISDVIDLVDQNVNEADAIIQSRDEYIAEQGEDINSVINLFYVLIGGAALLAFIGTVNNQIISFLQRKKELAILNSTCMSKRQIKEMLLCETFLFSVVASLFAILVGVITTQYINNFLQGMQLYVAMEYDFSVIFAIVLITIIALFLTNVIPQRKLKKIDIVKEIKYE